MTLEKVGVIGAGTMGNGIAQACAVAGLDVVMVDVAEAAVLRGLATITGEPRSAAQEGQDHRGRQGCRAARIKGTTDYDELKGCDLVIEAATENEELKHKILQAGRRARAARRDPRVEHVVDLDHQARGGRRRGPAQFIGMHFFNPVPMMALVELIRGLQTSDATVAAAEALAKRLGKTPIVVNNSPGFVVNRILCPMINEAVFALQEGLATRRGDRQRR